MKKIFTKMFTLLLVAVLLDFTYFSVLTFAQQSQPQKSPSDQGIGMEGKIKQAAPSTAPTIALPNDGTVFEDVPITVTGLCEDGLLVKVFKNNAFAGATMCENGSYTVQIDIFPGLNDLHALQYDDIDQESPESNHVNVTFKIQIPDDPSILPGAPGILTDRIILTTNKAREGVDPNKELSWPFIVSGGQGPYAISIDWGDGSNGLMTVDVAGAFDGLHKYKNPGIYKVMVKATDKNGISAFLQVIVVVAGEVSNATKDLDKAPVVTRTKILWWPTVLLFPFLLTSFWLGKRYQLRRVRYRMKHRISPIDK